VSVYAKLSDQLVLTPAISPAQPALRILLARTLAGKDPNGRHEPSRISHLGLGNAKHVSTTDSARPLADSQWEEETATCG
jgi:hypothetical protein